MSVSLTCCRVDLLSLDIEGAEQKVLETLPWGKVDIGMVMIEVRQIF